MAIDPDTLVDLTTAGSELEAEAIAEALRARGIHAEAFTTAGSMLRWEVAPFQPMLVQVRRANVEQARAALREIRSESLVVDWSQVDTGDTTPLMPEELVAGGETLECKSCGYDLSSLATANRCPECGADLRELPPRRSIRLRIQSLPLKRRYWVATAAVAAAILLPTLVPSLRRLVYGLFGR